MIKDKEEQKELRHNYYLKHKDEVKERSRKYRITHPEEVKEYRKSHKVQNNESQDKRVKGYIEKWFTAVPELQNPVCGINSEFHRGQIHWHHTDSTHKLFKIAVFIRQHSPDKPDHVGTLKAELKKCIPICNSCDSKTHNPSKKEE